jgi:membrane associated rhomboid family serine protease
MELLELRRYPTRREARVASLVLQAMAIPHQVQRVHGVHLVLVPAEALADAREQLELYERENPAPKPLDEAVEILASGWAGALGWGIVLVTVSILDWNQAFGLPWHDAGCVHSGQPEAWWRAITSLTLHANLPHLLGNVAFGVIFMALACQLLGTGVASLAVLGAGGLGNLLDAWARPPGVSSVGASTALFGAIGILVGVEAVRRRGSRGCMRAAAPLVIGLILLAWFGMGTDPRTNVLAHCTGLGAGVVVGALLGQWRQQLRLGVRRQQVLAWATLAVIVLAWWRAL